ncbi:uncharacterized protein [Branchiostoma lanceolatum]|uniref:uncharacterized protein n=1 Tax=Branchiostoma lanceolatum TaxID=7740 RepID=UPI003455B411
MEKLYVKFFSLVFLSLCFSGVTAVGNDDDIEANLTEATVGDIYEEDNLESPAIDSDEDIVGEDWLSSQSRHQTSTGSSTDFADSKEQEALRVLEAPTTSYDEHLGVDAADFSETSVEQVCYV